MAIQTLTDFFMWCSIINLGFMVLWFIFFALAPGLVYRTQRKWFGGTQETFNIVMYSYLALFKIVFLVFNVVPYIALKIIT